MEEISVEHPSVEMGRPQEESAPLRFRSIGFYRQSLAKNLGPEVFKTEPWRLGWYFACLLGAIFSFLLIVRGALGWPEKLALGIVIGLCHGTLAFIAHEIFHGSVIKNQKIQNILGFFAAIPFFISPTFWKFWHNRLHHGKTQQLIRDPDAFPNLRIYKASRFIQVMFPFTPGSGHKRSYLYFFFWFSFHNFVAQTYLRFRNEIFDSLDQRKVSLEFGAEIIIALAFLVYAGPANWIWVLFVPLIVQNYLVMSYISTNHNLSPLTKDNDPLLNSLTVTNNNVLEFLNLNFGYHVEHHIFPSVSGKHAKQIHKELLRQFPETYKSMPKWKAIKALYATPRIYKNAHELVNPETLSTHPTL